MVETAPCEIYAKWPKSHYVSCMGLEGLDQTTNAQIALVASMLKKLYVLRLATSAIRLMSSLYRA